MIKDRCFKKDKLNDELIDLVNSLLKTQREILKYVDLQEEELKKLKKLKSGWGKM